MHTSIRLFFGVTLSALFFMGCTMESNTQSTESFVQNVSVDEAKQLLQSNSDIIVLDVRTKEEVKESHMVEADAYIDFYSEDLVEQLNVLDKDVTYLVYCQSGNRSAQSVKLMHEIGFTHLYNLEGGYSAWVLAE